jgi:hypothetical protein
MARFTLLLVCGLAAAVICPAPSAARGLLQVSAWGLPLPARTRSTFVQPYAARVQQDAPAHPPPPADALPIAELTLPDSAVAPPSFSPSLEGTFSEHASALA